MSTKQKLVVVFVLTALGLVAAQAARPAYESGLCPKPEILAGHWIHIPANLNEYATRYEIAFNGHGVGGNVELQLDGVGVDSDFPASDKVQTVVLDDKYDWWQMESPEKPIINITTDCGEASKSPSVVSPHAGYFGPQQLFGCADYIVIDSRGSGEARNFISPPGALFASKFRYLHPGSTLQLIPNPYPAVGGTWNMFLAATKKPGSPYSKSVVTGEQWLSNKLDELQKSCPVSLVLLTGYSQGAQVAGDIAEGDSWGTLGSVVLFGDPYFNPNDQGALGNFSHWYRGVLGIREDNFMREGRFLTYCHAHDPVCQGAIWWAHYRTTQHTNYDQKGEPQNAAKRFTKFWG